MQLQTTSPESKFPNEYSDVIFIQIDQHLKKLLQKYKGSRFYETRCINHRLQKLHLRISLQRESYKCVELSTPCCRFFVVSMF